jgi:hypothetical protein
MTTETRYRHHSVNRGNERYGLELTRAEYDALSVQIAFHAMTEDMNFVRLSPAGGNRERWAVWFKGEWLPLIFDPVVARVVTVLPKNELRKYQRKLPW